MSIRSQLHALKVRAASWIATRSMFSSYEGGRVNRLLLDFMGSVVSPDTAIRENMRQLRARARDLEINNAYIAGFCHEVESNMIGSEGIQLDAKITIGTGKAERQNAKTNFAIEAAWKEWSFPENATLDTRDSWIDVQRKLARRLFVDGEIILELAKGADNDFAFAVQMIDPDLLDETLNVAPNAAGVEVRMGVEVNKDQKPLAYHFFKAHPSELAKKGLTRERVRVPAGRIVHKFLGDRPGQTRGVTMFAPILVTVQMLDKYEEAELVAMRFAASKMGVITNNSELSAQTYSAPKAGEEKQVMTVAPGSISELGLGQGFQEFNPTHPNAAFVEFTKLMLRGVARALGISYLTLTGDLSAANYSSMRAGLLPERDHWRMLQKWMSVHIHRRVYRAWVPQAQLTGMLSTDARMASDLFAVEWKPRGWRWVDPKNDLEAIKMAIELGLTNRQAESAERGVDYEDNIDRQQYEQDYAEECGVSVMPEEKQITAPPKQLPPGRKPDGDEDTEAKVLRSVA